MERFCCFRNATFQNSEGIVLLGACYSLSFVSEGDIGELLLLLSQHELLSSRPCLVESRLAGWVPADGGTTGELERGWDLI